MHCSIALTGALLALATQAIGRPGVNHQIAKKTERTTSPEGCLIVRGSDTGSGEYSKPSEALEALGSGTEEACIFIYSGTYDDYFRIEYGGPLTFYGYTTNVESPADNTVTIQRRKSSSEAGDLDSSSVASIRSANFKAYNINFHNTWGKGTQAVAVTARGEQQGYYACGFYGYQDTLYAHSGKQYYSNCYIEGAVDFIFGNAGAWFNQCTIASNGEGYITANSRETEDDPNWYVFDKSTITTASGVSGLTEEVYLGRPWRILARVMYQNCDLSDIIHPEGWTEMEEGATPIFEEYNNSGAGSDTSARKYLTPASEAVTRDQLWGSGWEEWVDMDW
ncbi:hypothetical protein AJ79_06410 [Helicocarpus griseus UAMH5409]|uniref:Pectinesterase n=1 Tax=Helicocarpus griseus UAMH5409 TaxID=1447875 RepID=A0A2B7XE56_9EURO|nr:hypothetical protein AJ79_06410 [Helicocarpus griseus UAMH5409]